MKQLNPERREIHNYVFNLSGKIKKPMKKTASYQRQNKRNNIGKPKKGEK